VVEDPTAYVRQILLPRFRPKLMQPQVLAAEELPKIAEVISETSKESGVQKKFRAVRIRIEYVEDGRSMQEDVYCVLGSAFVSAMNTTFWGAERNYSFRTEKGKLDDRTRMYQTIVSSLKPNLKWFNRYVQLVQILSPNQLDPMRKLGDLSQYVPRTTDEISEPRQKLYQAQQAVQEKINLAFAGVVPGTQLWQNPSDKRSIYLPVGYSEVWASPGGDYLLSSGGLDPNRGANGPWKKLDISR
jgi:hypothetical protein